MAQYSITRDKMSILNVVRRWLLTEGEPDQIDALLSYPRKEVSRQARDLLARKKLPAVINLFHLPWSFANGTKFLSDDPESFVRDVKQYHTNHRYAGIHEPVVHEAHRLMDRGIKELRTLLLKDDAHNKRPGYFDLRRKADNLIAGIDDESGEDLLTPAITAATPNYAQLLRTHRVLKEMNTYQTSSDEELIMLLERPIGMGPEGWPLVPAAVASISTMHDTTILEFTVSPARCENLFAVPKVSVSQSGLAVVAAPTEYFCNVGAALMYWIVRRYGDLTLVLHSEDRPEYYVAIWHFVLSSRGFQNTVDEDLTAAPSRVLLDLKGEGRELFLKEWEMCQNLFDPESTADWLPLPNVSTETGQRW